MEYHFSKIEESGYRKMWLIMFANLEVSDNRKTLGSVETIGVTEQAVHLSLYKDELELRIILTDKSKIKSLEDIDVTKINLLDMALHTPTGSIETKHEYKITDLLMTEVSERNTFYQIKFKMRVRVSKITKVY